MNNWTHPNHIPTIFEQKLILGLVMEVGILIAMGTHCYEFAGKFFLQLRGGPIGLNITAWAASIVMKCYDNIWMAILRSNKIDLLAYLRYVDDSRSFIRGLRRGVRWCGGKFKYDIEWEIEDFRENLEDGR